MNLSTPLRYLVWFAKKHSNASERTVARLHVLAMAVYAAARFGL